MPPADPRRIAKCPNPKDYSLHLPCNWRVFEPILSDLKATALTLSLRHSVLNAWARRLPQFITRHAHAPQR